MKHYKRWVLKSQQGTGPLEGKVLYYVQDSHLGYATDNYTNKTMAVAEMRRLNKEQP